VLGYKGKILYIDLNKNFTQEKSFDKEFAEKYIGGVGFAIRLLYDETPPNVDPLAPENILVFATGPVCGTYVPCGFKCTVAAKSPLTGFLGESSTTSFWPERLKLAGYDSLLIKGKADEQTYLFVDNGIVEFRSADAMWGSSPIKTAEMVMEELNDESISVAAIGKGGENLVAYASIYNDHAPGQGARRTGMGAVMGSKNLKAIAVRGTNSIDASEINPLLKFSNEFNSRCQGSCTEKYRLMGTPANVSTFNELGFLPTRNFQQSQFEDADAVSGEAMLEKYTIRIDACGSCPIACDHVCLVEEGPFAGTLASIDYQSLWAFGANCGINNFPAVLKAVSLCDEYGIDAVSTGVTIAWAMECYEKGILKNTETEGMDLKFGNIEACLKLITDIALRRGLGKLLSQGVKKASQEIGKGSQEFAMQIKGLEMPGFDIRALKTAALGWAVAARGGCHSRSLAYDYDITGNDDRINSNAGRAELARDSEDWATILDSLAMCRLSRKCFKDPYQEVAKFYKYVVGIDVTSADLKTAAARINNLKKAFNIRNGWTKDDDTIPQRISAEPIATGPKKGEVINPQDLRAMINAYYQIRGWNEEGQIPKQRLITLQLNEIANELGI
jgi:aldehyde:ferredoxin oxidoreductase